MPEIFQLFLIFKAENDGCAERTVKAYYDILARYTDWLDGRDPLDIDSDSLIVFTGPFLHRQGMKPVSRRPYIACIRELYAWLHKIRRMLSTNPADVLTYPETGRKLPRFLSLENAEKLMWAPDFDTFAGVRDGAIMAILLGCGLRVSGITRLNDSNLLTQIINDEPRLAIKTLEKGDKERIIPVPREADLLLRIYLEHPELQDIDRTLPNGDRVLFVTTGNRKCPDYLYIGEKRRFSTRGLYGIIRRHGDKAGIPRAQLHPHALRHLYGTELAESDVNDTVRQQLMGHADPRSTQIYTHLASRKLTGDVDKGNPLAKIKTPVSDLLWRLAKR